VAIGSETPDRAGRRCDRITAVARPIDRAPTRAMTSARPRRSAPSGGWLLGLLYLVLLAGGILVARNFIEFWDLGLLAEGGRPLPSIAAVSAALYILVAAIPFVPAAEIGLTLMLSLGSELAGPLYGCTVASLMLAYSVGRLIPSRLCAAVFGSLGLESARRLTLRAAALDPDERLVLLLSRTPTRLGRRLLRHRYLALAVTLNLPGNALLGGGGGIAMVAGLSGLYSAPAFLGVVALAVAPVPLAITLVALLG